MGKTSKHKGNKTSRPYNTKISAQREVSDTQNLSREKSRGSSSKYVPRHLKSSSNRSGVCHFKTTETNKNLKPLSSSLKQKDFAAEGKEQIKRNNTQEMQQQEISGSESPKMSSNNQDEILDNSVPDSDSLSMKEENGRDTLIIESHEVTGKDGTSDVEKPILEENSFSSDVQGSEIEENSRNAHPTSDNGESQIIEFKSEENNDKELLELGLSSDDNYDPVMENHEAELNDEHVSSPEETEIQNSDTNSSLEVGKETDNRENNCDFFTEDVKENNPEEINGTMEGLDEIASKLESAEPDINPKGSNMLDSIHETPLPELVIEDNDDQSELHSDNPNSVSSLNSYSWAGNIRSVSARRPFRKSSVTPESFSTSGSRGNTPGKVLSSTCENVVNPSVHTSKNLFASMKRKAFENDSRISPKKLKVNDSQHSTFLSMVSTPLRLLKNKISDRIIENSKDTQEEKHINGNSEEGIEESEAKTEIHMKDKNVLIEGNQGISQDTDTYKRWCTIM